MARLGLVVLFTRKSQAWNTTSPGVIRLICSKYNVTINKVINTNVMVGAFYKYVQMCGRKPYGWLMKWEKDLCIMKYSVDRMTMDWTITPERQHLSYRTDLHSFEMSQMTGRRGIIRVKLDYQMHNLAIRYRLYRHDADFTVVKSYDYDDSRSYKPPKISECIFENLQIILQHLNYFDEWIPVWEQKITRCCMWFKI